MADAEFEQFDHLSCSFGAAMAQVQRKRGFLAVLPVVP
jgi:hypothetical protein